MFVCACYRAGVCLDFHCKDFTFGIRKEKRSQIQIILVLYCTDHLDKSAGLFVLGKSPAVLFQEFKSVNSNRPTDTVTSRVFLCFPSMENRGSNGGSIGKPWITWDWRSIQIQLPDPKRLACEMKGKHEAKTVLVHDLEKPANGI